MKALDADRRRIPGTHRTWMAAIRAAEKHMSRGAWE